MVPGRQVSACPTYCMSAPPMDKRGHGEYISSALGPESMDTGVQTLVVKGP